MHSEMLKAIYLLQADNLFLPFSFHHSPSVYTIRYQEKCQDDAARCEDFNCQEAAWAACTRCLAFLYFDHLNTNKSCSSHNVYSEFHGPDFTFP